MSKTQLTNARLREGIWEGVISGSGAAPEVTVTHLEQPIEGVELLEEAGKGWRLRVPIPMKALSDGVQTFLVQDRASGTTMASFSIVAGAPLSEDLRAEVDLLRAELDMLKRAFRRHCVEFAAGNGRPLGS
ncbi:MAG: hypothetical protein AAGF13_02060 [Pseudomonadota bacterium]